MLVQINSLRINIFDMKIFFLKYNGILCFHIRVNHGVELTGWGSMTKLGNTTNKLQATRLIIYPHMACNSSYDLPSTHPKSLEIELVLPNLIQSNLLCAGSEVCIVVFINKFKFRNHVSFR